MSDSTTQVLIAYIDGDLPEAEQSALEARIAANATLQTELNQLQLAKMAIESYGLRLEVHNILELLIRAPQEETGRDIAARWTLGLMRVAATLLFITFSIIVYLYFTLTPAKLYDKQARPFTVAASWTAADTAWLERAWQQKHYRQVIELAASQPVKDQKCHFYTALSFLTLNDLQQAISNFQAVLQQNRTTGAARFQDEAEYYLALSYLRYRQPGKALPVFIRIFYDRSHLYYSEVNWWFMARLHLLNWKG
jgi:hypothetical protein